MDERIAPPTYFQYSPSGVHSSPHHHMRSPAASERERFDLILIADFSGLIFYLWVEISCSASPILGFTVASLKMMSSSGTPIMLMLGFA